MSDEQTQGPTILNDGNFDKFLAANQGLLLVDFWAPWCGPCKIVSPTVEDLAVEHAGQLTVAKVNVDENPQLAEKFQILSIPTLKFFRAGAPVDEIIGAAPKATIKTMMEKLLSDNL